tara:strand:- start:2737 stop:3582 length:846 start_codon:yes stop_codon:yes gene_type:complete
MTFKQLSDCNDVFLREGPWSSRAAALGLGAASLFGGPGEVQAKMPTPITHTIKQDQSMYDYIVQSEGKGKEGRPGYAYRDHKGYLTVGVGHLITKNDPVLRQVTGQYYNAVVSGRMPLNDNQMKQLFNIDVQSKIALARRNIRGYDKLPSYVQNAVVDGFFRGDLSGSPDTLGLMNQGNWSAAATEYLDNDEYRTSKKEGTGVAPRMERNASIFAAYGRGADADPRQRWTSSGTPTNTYTVKAGDTLSKIARDNNVSIQDLMRKNNISDPNKISIGQQLYI